MSLTPVATLLRLFFFAVLLVVSHESPAALPELIHRVKPSVVAIGTFDKMRSPAFVLRGTGFVVGDGNTVATNAHVIPDSLDASGNESLVVRFQTGPGEGQQRVAKVARADKSQDLTLLRIDGAALPALPLHEGVVREGMDVAFIGFPIGTVLGLAPVTHRAIISSITPIAIPGGSANQLNEKLARRLRSGAFDVYQLDGTAYPGNSGGPLLDVDSGEVVGLINMVLVKGTKESVLSQPSGISYAIPVAYLRRLMQNVQ